MTTQTFHDHFSAFANRYADFRPRYPAAIFDFLATIVPRGSLVWDCACGNGQATIDLAERFDRVIATDASKDQIKSATCHPRVEYRVATAESSGLADKSVGLITVAQAIHWFDFDRFYAEVNRVLAGDGVIAVWAYGIDEVEGDAVNALAQDYYSNVVGPYWPPERVLVEQGYRTIRFPFTEISTPPLHMEMQWDLDALLGYFSTWSATNRFIKAKGFNPLERLNNQLSDVWGDRERTRRVTWPLSMRIGRKG
jgi:ubiquinone/menaquinone biosynthesis C-methylase UbiE